MLSFLGKLSWSHIFHLFKLLLQLFYSEFSWLVTGFILTIKIFASSPAMVSGKKAAVPNITDRVPYSL
jgi:hypothetical protein